jgi:DUF4097 and DUF4098 domain-containing protein YvlB
MTTFPTTGPISATLEVQWGDIWIVATDRSTTEVEVTPASPASEKDHLAAETTTVTFTDGRLRVLGPKNRTGVFNKKFGAVHVRVHLATGSHVEATTGFGAVVVEGDLGDCRLKTAAGDLRIQDAASADLRTGMGSIVTGNVAGDFSCKTGTGPIRIEGVGGRAEVRTANGDTWIGAAGGPVRIKAANGAISIDRAQGDVVASTPVGNLRVGSAEQGVVQLKTSTGRIEVGIPAGTSALLDLSTKFGVVRNELEAATQPASGERFVEIQALTSAGDIDVTRVPTAR